MTFQRTTDTWLVRSFLTDPKLWRRMVNDDAPKVEEFQVKDNSDITYIVGVENRAVAEALFLLCKTEQPNTAEVHFCMAPDVWGRSLEVAAGFLSWVWKNMSLRRLTAKLPSYNRLAKKLAEAVGFRQYGIRKRAGTRRGVSFDLLLLDLRRPA